MRLRTELALSFATIVILAFLLSALGGSLTTKFNYAIQDSYQTVLPSIRLLNQISSTAHRLSDKQLAGATADELSGIKNQLRKAVSAYEQHKRRNDQHDPITQDVVDAALELESQRIDSATSTQDIEHLNDVITSLHTLVDIAIETALGNLERSHEALERAVNSVVKQDRILRILILAMALLFAFLLARTIARPISTLRRAVQRIGEGDYGIHVQIPATYEIKELIRAFNSMSSQLQETTVSRERLDELLRSLPDSLIVVDQQGYITLVNEATKSMLGYSTQELQEKLYTDIFSGESPDTEASQRGSFPWQQEGQEVDIKYRTCADDLIPVRVSISTIEQENGEQSLICIGRDLRSQYAAEREVRSYRERMQHAEQLASLGQMSAVFAHRINQPLTSMRLFLQQVQREVDKIDVPEFVHENLQDCLEEISRVSTTVKDILRYTRRPHENYTEDVSLADIARKVIYVLSTNAADRNLELQIENMQELPTISGAPDELAEMFFVLVQNAVDAAPDDHPARLVIKGCAINMETIRIEFIDTCGGISQEYQGRIFEDFFTTKPRGRGTGLGLSIAQQVAQHHDGHIEFSSTPGKGTIFTVTLPVQPGLRDNGKSHDGLP